MKVKRFEEVNYIAVKNNIVKHFKILSVISITLVLIMSFISLYCMKLELEKQELKLQIEDLKWANEDLMHYIEKRAEEQWKIQEDNMKLQEMIDNVKNKR